MIPHVLLAEDDADTRAMVQLLLTHVGFHVTAPDNPLNILQLAGSEQFDVIILDNWMPGITGIELCRQIRAFDTNTPIIFCSGAVTNADIEAAALAGSQGYVTKPFDPDDLIRTLHAAVNKRHLTSTE